MQVTKIYNSFNNLTENKCNRPTFGHAKLKHLYTKDFFVKSDLKLASLSEIKDITPVAFAGTKCRGAIMLKNFWDTIAPKNLKKKFILSRQGLSTNKNGFADSFLKTQAHKPISTSFVHDCAVMYLYNDKTKTHAMYHAAPNTKVTDWIKAYGNNLYHMHIHNNYGKNDDHSNLSDGTLDFKEIFECIKETKVNPSFVFEMYNEDDIIKSYQVFKENNN